MSVIFTDLCVRLADDLRRKGYVGRTVGIKLRYTDFRIVTRDVTLPDATNDATVIRRAAGECLRRAPLDLRLRLLLQLIAQADTKRLGLKDSRHAAAQRLGSISVAH